MSIKSLETFLEEVEKSEIKEVSEDKVISNQDKQEAKEVLKRLSGFRKYDGYVSSSVLKEQIGEYLEDMIYDNPSHIASKNVSSFIEELLDYVRVLKGEKV